MGMAPTASTPSPTTMVPTAATWVPTSVPTCPMSSPTTMAPTASTPSPTTAAPTPALTCGNFCNDNQVSMCTYEGTSDGKHCKPGTDSCSACSGVDTKLVGEETLENLGCDTAATVCLTTTCVTGCPRLSECLASCSNRASVNRL